MYECLQNNILWLWEVARWEVKALMAAVELELQRQADGRALATLRSSGEEKRLCDMMTSFQCLQ
jgi:hypothetical protein